MSSNSRDLLKQLEAYAGIDPPAICWLSPDNGKTYCEECAEEQVNYFGSGTFVDGGWAGQDSDCCIHCATCGRALDYWLTTAGVANELAHFHSVRFPKPLSRDDAFHVARLLGSAPDDMEVIAVARRAIRAIKYRARVQPVRSYAVYVDGYGEAHYAAASPAEARAMAYRRFCETVTRIAFHEFLVMSRVKLAGRPPDNAPAKPIDNRRGAA